MISEKLPAPVQAYFAGKRDNDIDAMLAPFAEDAVVQDEGGEMRGLAEIREWMRETIRKYRYTVEITGVEERSVTTSVTCRLTGAFPGSPLDVTYAFALNDAKITSLQIS